MLMFISGISTSGKTYVGKKFVEKRNSLGEEWVFKDLDDFYIDKKPLIKLSNGKEKENWDCFEAIDYKRVKKFLEDSFAAEPEKNVCLVGFALSGELIGYFPAIHFHLVLTPSSYEYINERYVFISELEKELGHLVIQNRQLTKGFKGDKAEADVLMVKEVLIPFYKNFVQTLDKYTILLNVRDERGERINVLPSLESIINRFNLGKPLF
mgnify:FL=1